MSLPFPLFDPTKATLLLFERQILTRDETLAALLKLGWTRKRAEALLQASYLLLPRA